MASTLTELSTTTRRKVTVFLSVAVGVVAVGFILVAYALATSK